MARSASIHLPADTWVELTNADATEVILQVQGLGRSIRILATPGATAPSRPGGFMASFRDGAVGLALREDFPGVPNAARLWGYADGYPATVWVEHA